MMRLYSVPCLAGFAGIFLLSASACFAQVTPVASGTPAAMPAASTSASTSASAQLTTVKTLDLTASPGASTWEVTTRGAPAERLFKKKILATAFAINKHGQVADIDHIEQGFPRELLRRLDESRQFLVRSSPDLLSFTDQTETPGLRLVRQVAAEHDSQFVIAGEIRNAGIRVEKKYLGLWRDSKRQIEVELTVYDGVSGSMLARHILQQEAEDEAAVGRDKPFGSAVFYDTSYGKTIAALLDEAARLVTQDLAPHAVLAKILKIGNGQIVIDAGKSSAISPGDLASVTAANNELPVTGLTSALSRPLLYGLPQSTLGKIAIIQSQQLFSVGELSAEVKPDEVKVGDFVRFDNVMAN